MFLIRTEKGPDGIFGEVRFNGATFFTLEHAYPSQDPMLKFEPKIPEGIYECVRGIHCLANNPKEFETFEIKVPGHTGILFHVGNYNKDSSGCVLLGKRTWTYNNAKILVESHRAFRQFMDLLKGIQDFSVTVKNEYL